MSRPRAILAVLLGASSYGLLSPLVKMAYIAGYSPEEVTLAQFIVAFLIMCSLSLFYRAEFKKMNSKTTYLLILLGCLATGTSIFYYESLKYLDPAVSIVLLFQFTWFVLVLDSMVRKRWPSVVQWVSVIVILIGTVGAVGVIGTNSLKWNTIGFAFGLCSAVTYGLFLYLTERLHTSVSVVTRTTLLCAASLCTCILILPAAFGKLIYGLFVNLEHSKVALSIYGEGVHHLSVISTQQANWSLWGWAAGIGILGQILPPMFFSAGIPVVGGALAGILGAIELPVAVVASRILLGDPLSIIQWTGVCLILLGMFLPDGIHTFNKKYQKKTRE